MDVVLDRARHIKVNDERHLADVAEATTEGVVDDEHALRRLPCARAVGRAEFGDDLLPGVLTHVLVQCERLNCATAELVRDRFNRFDGRGEHDLRDRGPSAHRWIDKGGNATHSVFKGMVLAEVRERLELPFARAGRFPAASTGSLAL